MRKCHGGYELDEETLAGADGDSKKKHATGCGNIQPTYRRESGISILAEFKQDTDMISGHTDRRTDLPASQVHQILR